MFRDTGELNWKRVEIEVHAKEWSSSRMGLIDFSGRVQVNGMTCWASVFGAIRRGLKLPKYTTEETFAQWYKDEADCKGNSKEVGGNWVQGIPDLACAMKFGGIWLETHEGPMFLTQDRLLKGLEGEHAVVCGMRFSNNESHVVVYFGAGKGRKKDPWHLFCWDPSNALTGCSPVIHTQCLNRPSFVAGIS